MNETTVIQLRERSPFSFELTAGRFKSGVVVCTGHETPRDAAIALLRGLVPVEKAPIGEQLDLFAEVGQ